MKEQTVAAIYEHARCQSSLRELILTIYPKMQKKQDESFLLIQDEESEAAIAKSQFAMNDDLKATLSACRQTMKRVPKLFLKGQAELDEEDELIQPQFIIEATFAFLYQAKKQQICIKNTQKEFDDWQLVVKLPEEMVFTSFVTLVEREAACQCAFLVQGNQKTSVIILSHDQPFESQASEQLSHWSMKETGLDLAEPIHEQIKSAYIIGSPHDEMVLVYQTDSGNIYITRPGATDDYDSLS